MKRIVIPLVLLLAGAAIAGHLWWQQSHPELVQLKLYGNVDIREVEMAFRQSGRIARLNYDEGTPVRSGDILAELDPQPFADAVALAQANKAQAQAELQKLTAGSRPQEIAHAEQAVAQAEAAMTEAQRQYERQSKLYSGRAITQSAFDAARSTRDQAQAALAAAKETLSLRREGARREDIAAAKARVEAAEAQLAQTRTALADTRLAAPSDALVSARLREVGSMVGTSVPVYTLSLQEPVYVRAYVSEPQLPRLRPGAAVVVHADGTSESLKGTVGFISPRAEFTPKSVETKDLRTDLVYRVRIVVPGGAKLLRQGMPVTVEVIDDKPAA